VHHDSERYRFVTRDVERASRKLWSFSGCAYLCHAFLQALGVELSWVHVPGPRDEVEPDILDRFRVSDATIGNPAASDILPGDIALWSNPWHVEIVRGIVAETDPSSWSIYSYAYGQAAPYRGGTVRRSVVVGTSGVLRSRRRQTARDSTGVAESRALAYRVDLRQLVSQAIEQNVLGALILPYDVTRQWIENTNDKRAAISAGHAFRNV